jgi:hypothetical protein
MVKILAGPYYRFRIQWTFCGYRLFRYGLCGYLLSYQMVHDYMKILLTIISCFVSSSVILKIAVQTGHSPVSLVTPALCTRWFMLGCAGIGLTQARLSLAVPAKLGLSRAAEHWKMLFCSTVWIRGSTESLSPFIWGLGNTDIKKSSMKFGLPSDIASRSRHSENSWYVTIKRHITVSPCLTRTNVYLVCRVFGQ